MLWLASPPYADPGAIGRPPDGEQAGLSRVSGRLGRTCVSDITVLGSDVAAVTSSDQRPADQAGTPSSDTRLSPDAGPASDNAATSRRRGGLSGMVMAELRQLAAQLGVPNISGMRKNDLISAIKERQGTVPGQ